MGFDKLIEKIINKQNPVCVGMDTTFDMVPHSIKERYIVEHGKTLKAASSAILEFNTKLLDEVASLIPAIKVQCAFFEMYGIDGIECMHKTIAHAKELGLYIITDGKRGDIANTMQAYAISQLGAVNIDGTMIDLLGADAMTVNAYMGEETVFPALEICDLYDKGIFVLTKTSNASSRDLQDLILHNGDTVSEAMAKLCDYWGKDTISEYGFSSVGAVIGATFPEQLAEFRLLLPNTFFLIPGYGAQGGDGNMVKNGFNELGLGAIINNSRGVLQAYKKQNLDQEEFAKAAKNEVLRMKDELISIIGTIG